MNRPEEALQRAIVQWLEFHRARLEKRMLWFAVPNQRGTRSRAEMGVLKALGVEPGTPDLVLVHDLGRVVFVELKAPGKEGNLSPYQREFLERATRMRAPYYVIVSLEDFVALLVRYGLHEERER